MASDQSRREFIETMLKGLTLYPLYGGLMSLTSASSVYGAVEINADPIEVASYTRHILVDPKPPQSLKWNPYGARVIKQVSDTLAEIRTSWRTATTDWQKGQPEPTNRTKTGLEWALNLDLSKTTIASVAAASKGQPVQIPAIEGATVRILRGRGGSGLPIVPPLPKEEPKEELFPRPHLWELIESIRNPSLLRQKVVNGLPSLEHPISLDGFTFVHQDKLITVSLGGPYYQFDGTTTPQKANQPLQIHIQRFAKHQVGTTNAYHKIVDAVINGQRGKVESVELTFPPEFRVLRDANGKAARYVVRGHSLLGDDNSIDMITVPYRDEVVNDLLGSSTIVKSFSFPDTDVRKTVEDYYNLQLRPVLDECQKVLPLR